MNEWLLIFLFFLSLYQVFALIRVESKLDVIRMYIKDLHYSLTEVSGND